MLFHIKLNGSRSHGKSITKHEAFSVLAKPRQSTWKRPPGTKPHEAHEANIVVGRAFLEKNRNFQKRKIITSGDLEHKQKLRTRLKGNPPAPRRNSTQSGLKRFEQKEEEEGGVLYTVPKAARRANTWAKICIFTSFPVREVAFLLGRSDD